MEQNSNGSFLFFKKSMESNFWKRCFEEGEGFPSLSKLPFRIGFPFKPPPPATNPSLWSSVQFICVYLRVKLFRWTGTMLKFDLFLEAWATLKILFQAVEFQELSKGLFRATKSIGAQPSPTLSSSRSSGIATPLHQPCSHKVFHQVNLLLPYLPPRSTGLSSPIRYGIKLPSFPLFFQIGLSPFFC